MSKYTFTRAAIITSALILQGFFVAPAFAQYYLPASASQSYLQTGQTAAAYNYGNYGTSASCPQITRTLSRGMTDYTTGGQVSQLQEFLANRYGVPQLVVGIFGPLTQHYVEVFQEQNGLSPVGIVGPYSRTTIQTLCDPVSQPNYPIQPTYPTYPQYPSYPTPQPQTPVSCNAAYIIPGCIPQPQPTPNSTPSITIMTPSGGQSIVQGNTLNIAWNSQNAPAGSAVAIFILPTNSSNTSGNSYPEVIQSSLPTTGSFNYQIPSGTNGCASDAPAAYCGSYITQNGPNFQIVAKLYTPSNAFIQGMLYDPTRTPTYVASSNTATFTIYAGTGSPPSPWPSPPPPMAPTVTLTVNGQQSVSLAQNTGFTLAWSVSNAASCSGTEQIGGGAAQDLGISPNTSGTSAGAAPTGGVTYTLTCSGSGQSITRTATISIL